MLRLLQRPTSQPEVFLLITFQNDFKVLHITIITVLDVNAFERLLGPCREIMARNIDKYAEELAKLSVSD